MRTHRVVVLDVLTKHPPEMLFVDRDDMVEILRLSVPMTRSAMALAFGACTGVRIVSIPSRRARAMKSPP